MAVSKVKHKHGHEVVALILFAAGLLVLMGLVTYSASDPCFSVAGKGAGIKNAIGIIGSYLSDALLKLFGLCAYLIPVFLFTYAAYFSLGGEAAHPLLKKVGGVLLFVSLATLLGLQNETLTIFSEEIPSGGMLGQLFVLLMVKSISVTGAYIITVTSLVISLVLLTPFSLLNAFALVRQFSIGLSEKVRLLKIGRASCRERV